MKDQNQDENEEEEPIFRSEVDGRLHDKATG